MLRWLVAPLLLTTLACGRIGFDATAAADAGGEDGAVMYRDVRPVYIVGVAMPPLVPTVIGSPSVWTITPALPRTPTGSISLFV